MPKEKITATVFNNGPKAMLVNTLSVLWGAKGGAPEAPDGWVNAGFAQIQISSETEETGDTFSVELSPKDMDRLIRTLKRIRRKSFGFTSSERG